MEMAADKVRKSGASYENIYRSASVWLKSLLELICVFLRGASCSAGWGDTPQLRAFRAAALIHDLLEPATEKMAEGQGEGAMAGRESTNIITRRKGVL